jgi:hypothetical protein
MSVAKKQTFSVRLAEEHRQALQAEADKRGLAIAELGRMYIVEKLSEVDANQTSLLKEMRSCTALIIASLSEDIFLDDAKELVEQHRMSQEQTS